MISPVAITYAPLLRHLLEAADGGFAEQDLAAVAKAIGKVPSNLRRDLPRLREAGLIAAEGLVITDAGRAALRAIDGAARPDEGAVAGLLHHAIGPDPLNPRKTFDAAAIAELADSIAEHGLIQPLTVRPPADGGLHTLIAGERRWRAIGLLIARGDWPADRPVRCGIAEVSDQGAALMALIENLQREDLRPMEEARAFDALRTAHGLSTADIAAKIGKSQRHVQDRLSFLKLDADDQQWVDEGRIGIEDARRRAQRADEVAKEIDLKPDEAYLLAEIADRMERFPRSKIPYTYNRQTECAHDTKSPALSRLVKMRLVKVELDVNGNGRNYLALDYKFHSIRKASLPAIEGEAGVYRAAFLNGPFELSAEMTKAQEQKRHVMAVTRQANKKAKADAAALLAKVEDLGRRRGEPFWVWQLRQIAIAAKCPLPWSTDRYGMLLDANGKPIGRFEAGRWDAPVDKPVMQQVFLLAINAVCDPAAEPATVDMFADQVRQAASEAAE